MALKSKVELLVLSSKTLLERLSERALLIGALAPSTTRVSIGARRTTQTFLDASIATLGVKIQLRSDRCSRDDRVVGELDVALNGLIITVNKLVPGVIVAVDTLYVL